MKLTIFIGIFLVNLAYAVNFSVWLEPEESFCFYEIFQAHQKYSIITSTKQNIPQQLTVAHLEGNDWRTVFQKYAQYGQNNIRVDKLASFPSTYSFCLKNKHEDSDYFKIQFKTGLQMLQLHNLPDAEDGQRFSRQIDWVDSQVNTLSERSDRIQGLRVMNGEILGKVGKRMILFALIGLGIIAGINFVFYRTVKKTFKDRKLI